MFQPNSARMPALIPISAAFDALAFPCAARFATTCKIEDKRNKTLRARFAPEAEMHFGISSKNQSMRPFLAAPRLLQASRPTLFVSMYKRLTPSARVGEG